MEYKSSEKSGSLPNHGYLDGRNVTEKYDDSISKSKAEETTTREASDQGTAATLDVKTIGLSSNEKDVYGHLKENEVLILKRQIETPEREVGWRDLYRYSTRNDNLIIIVSSVCAIGAGAATPLMTVIFGQLAGSFSDYLVLGSSTREDFEDTISNMVLYFVYLALGTFATVYISTVGFIYTGEHISGKIRENYLEACLKQNIGYFDELGAGEITTRITADTNLVQNGISEKVGLTLSAVATFATAFVIGFIKSWKLTLILSSSVVALSTSMMLGSWFMVRYSKLSLGSYAIGGTVAEEVLSSIRNAVAFGTQEKLAREYDKFLIEGEKWGVRSKFVLAFILGIMFLIIYLTYGLGFWMGSRFLVLGEVGLSTIITVLMSKHFPKVSLLECLLSISSRYHDGSHVPW